MKKIIFLILLCVLLIVIHDFIIEQKRQIVIHNSSPYWLQVNVYRKYDNQTEDEAIENYWNFNLEKNESSPIYFSYKKKILMKPFILVFLFSSQIMMMYPIQMNLYQLQSRSSWKFIATQAISVRGIFILGAVER